MWTLEARPHYAALIEKHRIGRSGLLLCERGLNGGEGRIQLRAEARHDRDDGDGDAGGDEAVFDGGRTGFIREEVSEHVHDTSLLLSFPWYITPSF